MASPVETQQAFLEAHVDAFEFFGGVFARVRYDNLGSAVKQVLQRPPAASRPTASSRCARTTCSSRSSPRRAWRARTRRAASRARSGASAATTWSRSRGRLDLAELNALLRAACEPDLRAGSPGRTETVGEALGARAAAAARAARRAVRRDRDRGAARRRQGAGHGPPEPLLGPGRAGRAEGRRADRRARDHDQPRRPGGRAPRAAARPFGTSAQLDHYLELLARKPGALARSLRAGPGARARRLARLLRRALGRAHRPLRALGGRRGRWSTSSCSAASTAPSASSWPSAARSPPARIDGRAVAVLARRAERPDAGRAAADRPRGAAGRARSGPRPTSPTTTSCSEAPR